MRAITLTINGRVVTAEVEPRTHLADFLREHLSLTGTHLGCEHGICGACTLVLDGVPARSCIAYAAACDGAVVESIEGLEHDPVIERLRQAFTAEHGLQCGYCTPGMLVTARDIVTRLPDADDGRIRLELAGNLCRCTGYQGIVRAIRRVLDERLDLPRPAPMPLSRTHFPEPMEVEQSTARKAVAQVLSGPEGEGLSLKLPLAAPRDAIWRAVRDPRLIASCLPGARLTAAEGDRIEGELTASLGPIQGRFVGHADLSFDDASHTGSVRGEGRDQASGTNLTAEAAFRIRDAGPDSTIVELDVTYSLRGALTQFGRGPVVRVFAAEIAEMMGRNLEAALSGAAPPSAPATLSTGRLFLRVVWRWLRTLLSDRH
jgi:carbon-monoxide dehydrogenase small subunit